MQQLFATIAQANGQTVERRLKLKENTLDRIQKQTARDLAERRAFAAGLAFTLRW